MTISSEKTSETFDLNGVTTVFPFGTGSIIAYDNTSELVVVHTDSDGLETTLTETTDYTILDQDCTYPAKGATGEKLTVYRSTPITQPVDIKNQSSFFPEVLESALDGVIKNVQEIASDMALTVKVPISSGDDPATYMTTITTSVTAAALSESNAAASASAASTSASNAATSETNAASSASAASTSET
ncbi:MAG: hypothetical protein HQL70_12045, partial [Magnetococcales bacterium]|nr:hypothetical protein [Magnetococcales bacterium]